MVGSTSWKDYSVIDVMNIYSELIYCVIILDSGEHISKHKNVFTFLELAF